MSYVVWPVLDADAIPSAESNNRMTLDEKTRQAAEADPKFARIE